MIPRNKLLAALVTLYAVLTSLLVITVPLNQAPDEFAHFDYVGYVANNARLPLFKVTPAPLYGYEFHQPPLYYALCTPAWRVLPGDAPKYLCRLVSVLCGALTLFCVWAGAAALFPDDPLLPALATGLAALWPLHQNVGASAGNDALGGLICAAEFALMAIGLRRGWQMRDSLWLGALVGLGLLTKNTCLAVAPVAVAAVWLGAGPAARAKETAIMLAVAALIGGWWLARNDVLYGDPLAAAVFLAAFRQSSPGPAQLIPGLHLSLFGYLKAWLTIFFCTLWGFFGGPQTALRITNPFSSRGPNPQVVPALGPIVVCLLFMAGSKIGFLQSWPEWRAAEVWQRRGLLLWSAGLMLVLLSLVQFNLQFFQAQARYLQPALAPLALFMAAGWQRLFRNRPRPVFAGCTAVVAVVLVGITLWNVIGWRTLV